MKQQCPTLIIAPYAGEFGWELMNWQGRVRRVIALGGHERIFAVGTADRRRLYEPSGGRTSFTFIPLHELNLPGHANEDHRVDESGRRIPAEVLSRMLADIIRGAISVAELDAGSTEILMPPFDGTLWPTTRKHQHFASLRTADSTTTDIVLVPRTRTLADERNQPVEWWRALEQRLQSAGLVVETYASRLDDAIGQLSSSRLAIGASTGGLHLASLCGCPHYVWGCGPEARWTRMGITNRQRYETVWNPLATPCIYDECGWRPTVEHVAGRAMKALERIGLRRGADRPAWRGKTAWRLRRGLSRLMEPEISAVLPWRLRTLIAEHVV